MANENTQKISSKALGGAAGANSRLSALMDRVARFDPATLPILNKLPAGQRFPALALIMLVSAVLTVIFIIYHLTLVGNQAEYIEISTELQMQSQRYSKVAQQAVLGNKAAFTQLDQSRKSFEEGLGKLISGGGGVTASPARFQDELGSLKKLWDVSRKDIDAVLAQQNTLIAMGQSLEQINARNIELLDLTEQVISLLPGGGKMLTFANQQALWTQRMAKNANALMSADVINPETAYQLGQDTNTFREVLEGMLNGSADLGLSPLGDSAARDKLVELQEVFTVFEGQVNGILRNMPQLVEAKRAARAIFDQSDKVLTETNALTNLYEEEGTWIPMTFSLIFAFITLASLMLLALTNVAEARRRADESSRGAEEAARENRRNQDAILRLLNEMGELAEGNLSVRATVTEDITGAIADSVNFAIEELRSLVENVNRAADQVTQATVEAKQVSDEMLAAAERQSGEIARTTEAVNRMSESINQVSRDAADSARVAGQSLESAKKGGDSVRNAIEGMNSIRDQIQETSKRIKRLGESSQEIGEIVELISDITEQTNVLALNAAIQAAAAGEAGRGFSVVAEEVQRLAERSAQATRRIGAIVKTIQSDTQDAVHAMEISTQGVVEGTLLSDTAGHALQDIESVSDELARLIQSISDATRDQAGTATQIAANMQQILGDTIKSSESAQRSAQSIGQLAMLSDELKVSVSGFKL